MFSLPSFSLQVHQNNLYFLIVFLKDNLTNKSLLLCRHVFSVEKHFKVQVFSLSAWFPSHLDNWNSLYSGLRQNTASAIQLVQNSVSCLLVLELIWLITFKALHGSAPSYTADLLPPYEPELSLRSSGRAFPGCSSVLTQYWRWPGFCSQAPSALQLTAGGSETSESVTVYKSLLKHIFLKKPFINSSTMLDCQHDLLWVPSGASPCNAFAWRFVCVIVCWFFYCWVFSSFSSSFVSYLLLLFLMLGGLFHLILCIILIAWIYLS